MDIRRDPRVDEYIANLPDAQHVICQHLRALIHLADPEIEETIKRTVQPYFVLDGNVCALLATKDHVNLFLYDPTVADPRGVINQGHDNATAKAIQIYRREDIDDEAVVDILREIIAHNRAGGWRSLQQPDGSSQSDGTQPEED